MDGLNTKAIDIFQGLRYPTEVEYNRSGANLDSNWNSMMLESPVRSGNLFIDELFLIIDLDEAYIAFNRRIFETKLTYKMAVFFYNNGIPDDPWYISPGKDQGVDYFPNFKEDEHYVNHYWFNYYTESFYSRFQGVIDYLFHIINKKYCLNIEDKVGFNKFVLNKLKVKEPRLRLLLNKHYYNNHYKELLTYRNNIIHNSKPGEISGSVTKQGGLVAYGIGEYTSTTVLKNNMDKNIQLLSEHLKNVKHYVII